MLTGTAARRRGGRPGHPAGRDGREAGEAHVRFNSAAQAFASRIVRQGHKQLTLLGVVHTHPGSLRHPSRATSAATCAGSRTCAAAKASSASAPPTPNRTGGRHQLAAGTERAVPGRTVSVLVCAGDADRNYRPLPVELTIGPGPGGAAAAGVGRVGGPRRAAGPAGPAAEPGEVRGDGRAPEAGLDSDGAACRTTAGRSGWCWKERVRYRLLTPDGATGGRLARGPGRRRGVSAAGRVGCALIRERPIRP